MNKQILNVILFLSLIALGVFAFLLQKTKYKTEKKESIAKLIIHVDTLAVSVEKINCLLSYADHFGNKIIDKIPSNIRYRGNTSMMHPKKHFAIELSEKFILEGFSSHRNWILAANYLDMTFLRNVISYDLFRLFSSKNKAPKTAFVELYFNAKYHGIYVLTERVDAKRLKLESWKKGALLFKAPPITVRSSVHDKKYRGFYQYYMDSDRWKDYTWASRKKMAIRAYFNQRYPKFEKKNVKNVVYDLTDFIFDSSDSLFASPQNGVQTIFDIDNIIDWQILLLLSNNSDGVQRNYYLYKENEEALFKVCPWDYDHGYGRDGDAWLNMESFLKCNNNHLFERLTKLNVQNYNQRLFDRFLALKKDFINDDFLFELIDVYAEKLKPHVEKNNKRWPLHNNESLKESSFKSEIQLLKDWLSLRIPKVELYLEDLLVNNQ